MVISEYVTIRVNKVNRDWYIEKGYAVDDKPSSIAVHYMDLMPRSKAKLTINCDYCGQDFIRPSGVYFRSQESCVVKKDACNKCRVKKMEENNYEKYGVKNVMQADEFKESLKMSVANKYGVSHYSKTEKFKESYRETCISKYGVEHYSKTDEFKEKAKLTCLDKYGYEYYMSSDDFKTKSLNTNLEKYGCHNPMLNEDIKSKRDATNLEKYGSVNLFSSEYGKNKIKEYNIINYGVEYYSQSEDYKDKVKSFWSTAKLTGLMDEIVDKRKNTNLEKYGCEHPLQNYEVSLKMKQTMFKNSTAPSSKQQVHLCNLFNGVLNYPVSRSFLDIAFPSEKIYVEYDGGGHDLQVKLGDITCEEFRAKEKRRMFHLLDDGWKEIRIISEKDKLLSDKKLIEFIDKAKLLIMNTKIYSIRLDMDKQTVSINYGDYINMSEFGGIEV